MTREKATDIFEHNWTKLVNPDYTDEELSKAVGMAIKALEQEPILDKIKAEIEEHRNKTEHIDKYDLVGDCLDIIDKYRK